MLLVDTTGFPEAYPDDDEIPLDTSSLPNNLTVNGTNKALDQVIMDRILTAHYQQDLAAETSINTIMDVVAHKSAETTVRKDARLVWIVKSLRIIVFAFCVFMLGFNYYVYSRNYLSATKTDQALAILSFVLIFIAAFICIAAPHTACCVKRVRGIFFSDCEES